jgi:hypothetical protein
MTTLTINGQQVTVDDSFLKLTPEQQEAEVNHIASQMGANKTTGGAAEPTPQGGGIPMAPAGAVIGAATGAATGPAIGKTIDTGINTAAKFINPAAAPQQDALTRALSGAPKSNAPQAVQNWLKTQTSNPFAGGKDMSGAYKKSQLAAGEPVQSRGSNIPIRKGNLGISNQLPEPTPSERVASSILNAERVGAPHMLRRVAGMGVAGGELGNLIEEAEKGNYGRAALSGLGALGGAATQSRIKPVRAIGTALAAGVPAVQYFLPEDVEHKADGGSVHLAGGGQPESKLKKITKHIPMPATANLALNLGLGASDISQSHENLQKNLQAGNYGSAANNAIDLGSTVSPYMLVPSIYQGGRAASEFARNQLAENPHYRQQMQDMSSTPMGGAMTGDAGLAAQIMGQHEFEEDPGPYGHLLRDSNLPHHAAGGKIIEAGADIAKTLFTPRETKILRASEALAPHEGKWLNLTQSDRMRSTEGDLGGPGFSKFQLEKPEYAEAQAAWGVGKKPTASGIVNVNKRFPEGQALWAPMIGGETQHHSNQHVYDMLANEFNRQAGMGNLPAELQARINARIAQAPATKGMFPEHFDIGNPEHLSQYGDTFNRRGALSTVMSGEGVGGTKGRIIDYPGIMQEMTDPMTVGAPTHSIGTRLFSLSGDVEHRPDLHSAFPYILKGEDQGVAFAPVPKELGIQDFINQFKEFKGRDPGYYDLVRTTPSQQITDKYLKSLEEAGHKKGGKVKKAKKK